MFHERFVADVNLTLLQHGRHGHDHRELLQVPPEVVRHRQHRAIALADEDDLRRLVEQAGISPGYVEAAERAERRSPPRQARRETNCQQRAFHVSPRWAPAARWWDAPTRSACPEGASR